MFPERAQRALSHTRAPEPAEKFINSERDDELARALDGSRAEESSSQVHKLCVRVGGPKEEVFEAGVMCECFTIEVIKAPFRLVRDTKKKREKRSAESR